MTTDKSWHIVLEEIGRGVLLRLVFPNGQYEQERATARIARDYGKIEPTAEITISSASHLTPEETLVHAAALTYLAKRAAAELEALREHVR